MIQKKVCLLGAFSVGKTSLIQRYVNSIFSDKYLTTVGVKIDKKQLTVKNHDLTLMIWDIAGEDDFSSMRDSYLRGLSGYIVVIDPTRPATFETALAVHNEVKARNDNLPVVFSLNKSDLKNQWKHKSEHIAKLEKLGFPIVETSAKDDIGVETSFVKLAEQLV